MDRRGSALFGTIENPMSSPKCLIRHLENHCLRTFSLKSSLDSGRRQGMISVFKIMAYISSIIVGLALVSILDFTLRHYRPPSQHMKKFFVASITIWDLVCTGQSCTRGSIRSRLTPGQMSMEDANRLNNSINLVLRLWLPLHVQEQEFSPAAKSLQWEDKSTLTEFVRNQFPTPSFLATRDRKIDILDPRFTAINLYSYCGITIKWTCNLVDHLKFDREMKRVTVFTLKQCLQDQVEKYESNST
jgi:hypothetical protein